MDRNEAIAALVKAAEAYRDITNPKRLDDMYQALTKLAAAARSIPRGKFDA